MIDYVQSKMVGMAYPAVSESNFFKGLFPLPPSAEQTRIVAKLDSLMCLCGELENKVKENQKNSELLMEAVLREAFAS